MFAKRKGGNMSKIAIVYWSGTGNTQVMAKAIYDAAKDAGKDVEIFNVSEISPQDASKYDVLALGCPSMGMENLEEDEFEPFFAGLENSIKDKSLALFGSYGWGDGQWMRDWIERAKKDGAILLDDQGLIVNETPDDEGIRLCKELASKL